MNRAVREVRGLRRDLGRMGRTSERAAGQTRGLAAAWDRGAASAAGFGGRTGGLVSSLRGVAAAYLSVHSAIRLASRAVDFETALSRITGLVGVARDEVQDMGEQVLALAPEVGKGPGELADALFFVTSAGARGAAAIEILRQSARAAAAGLGETKTVADAVTSAINAYGPAALNAGTATGILVAAVREGKADAASFAPVLGRVLPVASELGVEFHEVAAAISFMTRQGLNANEASTNLRSTLSSLLRPSRDAKKALKEFDLDSGRLRRTLREEGLIAALDLLRETLGDNKEALSWIFPDINALTTVLSIVGANADTARAIFVALAKAGIGEVNDALAAVEETVEHRYNVAVSKLEAQAIRLGADVLPVVASVPSKIADNLDLVVGAVAGFAGYKLGALFLSAAAGARSLAVGTRTAAAGMTALNFAARANPLIALGSTVATLTGFLVAYAARAREATEETKKLGAASEILRIQKDLAELDKKIRTKNSEVAQAETNVEFLRGRENEKIAKHQGDRSSSGARAALENERGLQGDRGKIALEALRKGKGELQILQREKEDLSQELKALLSPRPEEQRRGLPFRGQKGDAEETSIEQRKADDLSRIQQRLDDEIARSTLSRIALVDRALQQQLERIETLRAKDGSNAKQVEEAKLAARKAAALKIQAIEDEELKRIQERLRKEAEAATEAAHARAEVLQGIEAAGLALSSPYDRAIAEIHRWEQEALASLARVGLATEEHAKLVEDIVAKRQARAEAEDADRRLQESKRWQDGAIRGLRRVADEAEDAASFMEGAVTRAFGVMEDAIVEFARTGKLSFSGLVDSIISDMIRMSARTASAQIAGFLGGLFSVPSGGPALSPGQASVGAGVWHTGGFAGALSGVRRRVDPGVFAGAPRLHQGGIAAGLQPGDVPTILQRGEGVFTPAQMAALGPASPSIQINFENRGTPQREIDREMRFDGRRWVVSVVTDDLTRGGPISKVLDAGGRVA